MGVRVCADGAPTDSWQAAAEAIREGEDSKKFAFFAIGVKGPDMDTLRKISVRAPLSLDGLKFRELAIVPMTGEYANMTHFVTDNDAVTLLATRVYPDRALRVAAFTDGVQRLALNLSTNTPHEPFFSPFFISMAKATAEQVDALPGLLVKFLGSAPVNERTDDDKTLAFALWVP